MATAERPAAGATARATDKAPGRLSEAEFKALAEIGVSRAVMTGDELFRRGEAGFSMYLIDSGSVRLSFDDGMAEKLVGPGQFFGELAVFVGEHLRSARAIAETDSILYEVTQPAFDAFLAEHPLVAARFMRRSFAYLVAGEHQLVENLRRRNEDLMQALDALRETRSELGLAQQLVRTDEMTGLANRRGLYRFLDEFGRMNIAGLRLGLLLIDVDRFKRINDRFGHIAGDSVLRAVADELRRHAGPLELPCRLGGDEFALIVRVADAKALAERAGELAASVAALRLPSMPEEPIGLSIGGAFCADPGGWSVWYSEADRGLYRAKTEGGGTFCLGG